MYRDDVYSLNAKRKLVVGGWRNAPEQRHVEPIRQALAQMGTEFGNDYCMVNVIFSGTPKFDDSVRNQIATVMAESKAPTATAYIILLGGLPGLAIRTFIGTLNLLSRRQAHSKTFTDVDDAFGWLSGALADLHDPWTLSEFRTFVESLRQ